MKQFLIILSTFLLFACNDIELEGYTNSIIKEPLSSASITLLKKEQPSSNTQKTSLEDDLASLDRESLKVKLLNYYPKPEGNIKKQNNCYENNLALNLEKYDILEDCEFDIPQEPNDGSIKEIDPSNEFPFVFEDKKQPYKYGLDNLPQRCIKSYSSNNSSSSNEIKELPKECFDPAALTGDKKTATVFISAKMDKNDPTKLNTHSPNNTPNSSSSYCDGVSLELYNMSPNSTYADYIISHEWVYEINGNEITELKRVNNNSEKTISSKNTPNTHCISINKIEDSGIYTIYGLTKTASQSIKRKSQASTNRGNPIKIFNIKIIPYKQITKNIKYIELNGDDSDESEISGTEPCNDNDYKNCNQGFTRCCVKKYFDEIYAPAIVDVNVHQAKFSENILDTHINDVLHIQTNPGTGKKLINIIFTKPEKAAITGHDMLNGAKQKMRDKQPSYDDAEWHTVFAINQVRKKWELSECNLKLKNCPGFDPINEKPNIDYYLYNNKTNPFPGKKVRVKLHKIKAKHKETGTELENQFRYIIHEDEDDNIIKPQEGDVLYTEDGYPIIPVRGAITSNIAAQSVPIKNKKDDYKNILSRGSIIFTAFGKGETGYYTLMHELGHSFGLTDVALSDLIYVDQERTPEMISILKTNNSHYNEVDNNYFASSETNLMAWIEPNGKKIRYRPTQIVCTNGTLYAYGSLERPIPGGFELNQWECLRDCYQDRFIDIKDDGRIHYFILDVNDLKNYPNQNYCFEKPSYPNVDYQTYKNLHDEEYKQKKIQ